MRKKKHAPERIAACANLLAAEPGVRPAPGSLPGGIFPAPLPLHLEIGCGKGAFAVGTAERHPEWNILAVERIADVACLALEKARASLEAGRPDNLRFLIGDAACLGEWMEPRSVARVYLNFCDPWPKSRHAKRRLTHRDFLSLYRTILAEGGELFLKTDSESLFEFSLSELRAFGLEPFFASRDFHATPEAEGNVMTEYEAAFSARGMPIFCLRVRF